MADSNERSTIRIGAEFRGRVLAKLRDGNAVHSLLIEVDTKDGTAVGRLPVEQLRDDGMARNGRIHRADRLDSADRLNRGDKLDVRVIHVDRKRPDRFVLSQRAFFFHKVLDRLFKDPGWHEDMPEEHAWYFRKGRLRATAYFGNYTIVFRRAPVRRPAG